MLDTIKRLKNYVKVLDNIKILEEKTQELPIEVVEGYVPYKYLEKRQFDMDEKMKKLVEPGILIQDNLMAEYENLRKIEEGENFNNFRYILYSIVQDMGQNHGLDFTLGFPNGTIEDFWYSGDVLTKQQFTQICEYFEIDDLIDRFLWKEFYC